MKTVKYTRLTQQERVVIAQMHANGASLSAIASATNRQKSTISREIKRHSAPKTPDEASFYDPFAADLAAQQWRHRRLGSKISRSAALQQQIASLLQNGFSPEVIAGRLKLENAAHVISHESIYKWIYGAGASLNLQIYLVRARRKRGRRPCRKAGVSGIPERVSIHKRPDIADVAGHFESDTIIFAGHKGALVTLQEKKSRYIFAQKVPQKTAALTREAIAHMLSPLPESMRRSITFDNGTEFTEHNLLNDVVQNTYFCDPYASWQKGAIENANGIIRRDVPKKARFSDFSDRDIEEIIHDINHTPRKILDYLTPAEVMAALLKGQTPAMLHPIALGV